METFLTEICRGLTEKGAAIPVVLGIATVLGLISVRNSDLATRARENVREYLAMTDKTLEHNLKRAKSLKFQNRQFLHRYRMLRFAFLWLIAALTCLQVSLFLSYFSMPVSGFCGLLAFVTTSVATAFLMYEFGIGSRTLEANNNPFDDVL